MSLGQLLRKLEREGLMETPRWKLDAVYDMSYLGIGVGNVRCTLITKIPVVNGKLAIPAVRAGVFGAQNQARVDLYVPYLKNPKSDLYESWSEIRKGDVRVFVLESDWQRLFPSENEFGPVTP